MSRWFYMHVFFPSFFKKFLWLDLNNVDLQNNYVIELRVLNPG